MVRCAAQLNLQGDDIACSCDASVCADGIYGATIRRAGSRV